MNERNKRGIVIDASHKCMLKCHKCERAWYVKNRQKVPGNDLTVDQFKKIARYYTNFIEFCGQRGDVVMNPDLAKFLEITYEAGIDTKVNTAAGYRDMNWYIECFKANPNCDLTFGIDGLPEQSHIYRKNQDGVKLFNIMVEATKHLNKKPVWQYIAFNYNEDNIELAKEMARDNNIIFELNVSARFDGPNDPYIPEGKNLATSFIS